MIKNYFKIALRNLMRHKGYSFIHISGLAIGMACCILIFMWVQDELSFNSYHKNADNIYRVEQDQKYSEGTFHINVTPYPCAPVFKDKIPEVVNACRIDQTEILFRYKDKAFYETEVVGVDQTYFEMFNSEFIKGNPSTALIQPYSIVINDEIAEKFFGREDPIGKTVSINNKHDFIVTGVFKKLPHNVSLDFQIAFPFEFFKDLGSYVDTWDFNNIYTFVQLNPNANFNSVSKKITSIKREYSPDSTTNFALDQLSQMNLYSRFGFGQSTGNIKYVYMFSVIAIIVLLIACINFMNLSTARSANRAKEIGLRKVVGVNRSGLIAQFFGESLLLSVIGLIGALIIVVLLLSEFNELTGKEIAISSLSNSSFMIGILLITISTGLIAGIYPALYLSSYKPVSILQGDKTKGKKSSFFRKTLVVVQFSLSVFLIISTIVVYSQIVFMKDKDLGYNKENLIFVNMKGDLYKNYEAIKSEFIKTRGVISVSGSSYPPHRITANGGGAEWDGKDPNQHVLIGANFVDYNYCSTMNIKILEGRDFSEEFPGDLVANDDTVGGFLVNEKVVKAMGLNNKQAIGARFDNFGCSGKIVGVMKDFNFKPVNTKIEPIAFALVPSQLQYIIVQLAAGSVFNSLNNLEQAWEKVEPNYPFDFKFLDEELDGMYRTEKRMLGLLKYFSIFAIIIACLGLFGLAAFSAEQKTKEIGIRKVLGASELNLTYLLCREFVILVAIANLIAWVFSYYASAKWLEDFAYRIEITPSFFLIAGLLSVVIAIITVSYQSIKAALANPIESLKYE